LIVDSINVERDPIRLLLGTIREEVFLYLLFDLGDAFRSAELRFVPRNLAINK
jgi:hypothetical protein